MLAFVTLLSREQPRINKALYTLADNLPAAVRPVAKHTLDGGGKRLRPLLVLLMARVFGYRHDDIYKLAATMEFFHMATLIHDDLLDNADMRRGRPAAHHVFGMGKAVLAADALFSRACYCVAEFGDPRYVTCLTEAVVRTATGEIEEFDLQGQLFDTLDPYYGVITGKTAWMLRASAELGALRAGMPPDMVATAAEFGENLGMAFQIADDALDFEPSTNTGKPEGGDVREAKFTPPIFYYYQSLDLKAQADFRKKFADRTFSDEEIQKIVREVRSSGCQARTLSLADNFLCKATDALNRITPTGSEAVQAHSILTAAVAYVRNRNK